METMLRQLLNESQSLSNTDSLTSDITRLLENDTMRLELMLKSSQQSLLTAVTDSCRMPPPAEVAPPVPHSCDVFLPLLANTTVRLLSGQRQLNNQLTQVQNLVVSEAGRTSNTVGIALSAATNTLTRVCA